MIPRYQEQRKKNKVTASQVNTVVIPDWFTGFGGQSVGLNDVCFLFLHRTGRTAQTRLIRRMTVRTKKNPSGINQHEQ